MKNKYYYSFSIGEIGICEEEGFITDIFFRKLKDVDGEICETETISDCSKQIEEYLKGNREDFDIQVKTDGTDFQKRVWKALLNIGYGRTASYREIAENIGNPKAARAVGMANNKNPIIIIIPCHRIIGADGSLTGYAGGVDIKRKLLEIENNRR